MEVIKIFVHLASIQNLQTCAVARMRNHPGATIFTLSAGNRDSVREQVYSQLLDFLAKH